MPNRTRQPRLTAPLPPAAIRAIARIEYALAKPERELAARVRQALGFGHGWEPNKHLGETATRITVWDQAELNTVFERVGGTVTTRIVQRSTLGGESTWTATEITLTTDLPGIGYVEIDTDWHEESGGGDLPLMRAIDPEMTAA